MPISTQASCQYPHKHHVNIQTSVTSLSKQATSLSKHASRHYPNKRHVIMQTSVTSFIIQTRQASRHYPNKRPNPSIDTPHRTGTLGMTMYTHINYSQCVQEWIVVVQLQIAFQGFCPHNAEWRIASLCRTLSSTLPPSMTETVWRSVICTSALQVHALGRSLDCTDWMPIIIIIILLLL